MKLKKYFKNQQGLSLVEVMLAATLVAAISVGSLKMFQNMNQGQKSVAQNHEVTALFNEIRNFLSDPNNCSATFSSANGGINVNPSILGMNSIIGAVAHGTGAQWLVLKNGENNAVYTTNSTTVGESVRLKEIRSFDYDQDSRIWTLNVYFDRPNALGGSVSKPHPLRLKVEATNADGTGVLRKCFAISSGSDSLWSKGSNGIFYAANAPDNYVGIGTSNPSTILEVFNQAAPANPGIGGALVTNFISSDGANARVEIGLGSHLTEHQNRASIVLGTELHSAATATNNPLDPQRYTLNDFYIARRVGHNAFEKIFEISDGDTIISKDLSVGENLNVSGQLGLGTLTTGKTGQNNDQNPIAGKPNSVALEIEARTADTTPRLVLDGNVPVINFYDSSNSDLDLRTSFIELNSGNLTIGSKPESSSYKRAIQIDTLTGNTAIGNFGYAHKATAALEVNGRLKISDAGNDTCDVNNQGSIRYKPMVSGVAGYMEFCNGNEWSTFSADRTMLPLASSSYSEVMGRSQTNSAKASCPTGYAAGGIKVGAVNGGDQDKSAVGALSLICYRIGGDLKPDTDSPVYYTFSFGSSAASLSSTTDLNCVNGSQKQWIKKVRTHKYTLANAAWWEVVGCAMGGFFAGQVQIDEMVAIQVFCGDVDSTSFSSTTPISTIGYTGESCTAREEFTCGSGGILREMQLYYDTITNAGFYSIGGIRAFCN